MCYNIHNLNERENMIDTVVTNEQLVDDPVNTTAINERALEIPIGIRFLNHYPMESVDELGAVMCFYGLQEHRIVDLFEKDNPAGLVHNVDAMDWDFTGRNVLSLSTVEHIGLSDYDNTDLRPEKAIEVCEKIIAEADNYLISWGLLYHDVLDTWVKEQIAKDRFDWCAYTKDTSEREWTYRGQDMVSFDEKYKFDSKYKYANSNIFIQNKGA